jgi:hypothetical protein
MDVAPQVIGRHTPALVASRPGVVPRRFQHPDRTYAYGRSDERLWTALMASIAAYEQLGRRGAGR